MNYEPGFPKTMVHPSYQPAVLSVDVAATANTPGYYAPPGRPLMYPPIVVNSRDQEESERARGYRDMSEPPPQVATHIAEYPKMLRHPEHRDGIPATQKAIQTPSGIEWAPVPPVPEYMPDQIVESREKEMAWRAKGYRPPGHWDAEAFERAQSAPIPEGYEPQEWPKMIGDVIYRDPDAVSPEVLAARANEYPKWVGGPNGRTVRNAEEEAEFSAMGAAPIRQGRIVPLIPEKSTFDPIALKREIVGELAPMLKEMIREAMSPPTEKRWTIDMMGANTEKVHQDATISLPRRRIKRSPEHIAAMQAGRRRKRNADNEESQHTSEEAPVVSC